MDLKEIGFEDVDWVLLALVNTEINLRIPQKALLDQLTEYRLLKKDRVPWS
jgi:hypothetical protein